MHACFQAHRWGDTCNDRVSLPCAWQDCPNTRLGQVLATDFEQPGLFAAEDYVHNDTAEHDLCSDGLILQVVINRLKGHTFTVGWLRFLSMLPACSTHTAGPSFALRRLETVIAAHHLCACEIELSSLYSVSVQAIILMSCYGLSVRMTWFSNVHSLKASIATEISWNILAGLCWSGLIRGEV